MRVAFYAPLKAPGHAVPSGDRTVARLLVRAIEAAGHRVALASTLRAFEPRGDAARQRAIRDAAVAEAAAIVAHARASPAGTRPGAWFTYHLYHKAPDWLGPLVSRALGIPYLVAEASFAAKQKDGPWALGHAAAEAAIRRADAVLALTRDDMEGLAPLVAAPERLIAFPPFLDAVPWRAAREARQGARARLAAEHGLAADAPWLAAVGMMRPGDKLDSYRLLAAALARLGARPWRLLIAGDGPARAAVEAAFAGLAPERVVFLGALAPPALRPLLAAADLFAWPAVNEAYGMAILEAQAAGLPVVAGGARGVPDIVRDRETGLLARAGDAAGFAAALAALLDDAGLRRRLGARAAEVVAAEHDIAAAARRIAAAFRIARACAGGGAR